MKNLKVYFFALCFCLAIGAFFYFPTISQKKSAIQWEYCVITFTAIPPNVDNQGVINAVANICYLESNGCRNEEIKTQLVYGKFLQDFKLENNETSRAFAVSRAREIAFSKAVANLGLEGWEMTTQPSFELDDYVLNSQNLYTVSQSNKTIKPDIYFKRLKP